MEITPFVITKHLSDLVGRSVTMAREERPAFSTQLLYACYALPESFDLAVIKLDLALLGSLAGAMMGVPGKTVEAQAKAGALDEQLDDAAREIMNVVAGVFVERRVLFKGLFKEAAQYDAKAGEMMKGGWVGRIPLKATLAGYPGGCMAVVTNF